MISDEAFIRGLPKTEIHMHLEGSMEPETMFEMARRNGIRLRWESPEALRVGYEFEGLSSFLELYFEACAVRCLCGERRRLAGELERWL